MGKFLIVLSLICVIAFATNPKAGEHEGEVQSRIVELLPGNDGGLIGFSKDIFGYGVTTTTVEVKNYYLFSLTILKINMTEITIGFGALGHVWVFTDKLTENL